MGHSPMPWAPRTVCATSESSFGSGKDAHAALRDVPSGARGIHMDTSRMGRTEDAAWGGRRPLAAKSGEKCGLSPRHRLCGRASRRLQPRHSSGAVCTAPTGQDAANRLAAPAAGRRDRRRGSEGEKPRILLLSGPAEPSPPSGQGEGLGRRPAKPLPDRKPLAEGGAVRGTVAAAAEHIHHDRYSRPLTSLLWRWDGKLAPVSPQAGRTLYGSSRSSIT